MGTRYIVLSSLLSFLLISGQASAEATILYSDILASEQWKVLSDDEYRKLQTSLLSEVPFTSMSVFQHIGSEVVLMRVYSQFRDFDVLGQRGCISEGINLIVPDRKAIDRNNTYSFQSPAGATLMILDAKDADECRDRFLSGAYIVVRGDFDLKNILIVANTISSSANLQCPGEINATLVTSEPFEIRGADGLEGGYETQFTAKSSDGHRFYISAEVNEGISKIDSCRELLD